MNAYESAPTIYRSIKCADIHIHPHTCNDALSFSHRNTHALTDDQLLEKKGKIVFVDLAGSERLRDTGTKGKVKINASVVLAV